MSKADEKWDEIGDNPLVIISELHGIMEDANQWATDAIEFLGDEDAGKVLDLAIKIISGDIPEPQKIALVCVRLEAFAIKFRSQYSIYMGFKKGTTEANMKKNYYKELYTGIDRLVDALKYVVR